MIKITNDLNTLNGSLLEMKDQLITELANKGVTASYSSTTGLLGLIHKISEIPTETATITLTSNKNILSYADSETATLTATHSAGAGQSVSVYNAITGTKIGDMTDAGSGTYTYTYNSAGTGDISMTATSGALESNSVTIEDCKDYITGQTNQLTKFTQQSLRNSGTRALTYDSTNQYYEISISNNGESTAFINSATGLDDFIIEFEGNITNENGTSDLNKGANGLHLYSNSTYWVRMGGTINSQSVGTMNGSYSETEESQSLTVNKWYTHRYTITNDTMKHEIIDNDSTVYTKTINVTSSWITSNTQYGLAILWSTAWNLNSKMRNIKVKLLTTQ